MVQDTENTNKPLAIALTVIFHGLLLLLFFLLVFRTPIPPYESLGGGGGLEVNFGTSANGMGNVQPEQYIPIDLKIENQQASKASKGGKEEEILTQETEEAPAIKTNISKKKNKKEIVQEEEVKQTTHIQINDPVANPLALYKKKPKGASEGETGKPGDQGSPTGNMYSKNHTGDGGSGGGTGGGSGTGNGTGIGSGSGPGTGTLKGINYSLSGRKHRYLPPPPKIILEQQEIVVVKIWVDRKGDVVRVMAGEKGTSTTNSKLVKIAEKLASESKFDSSPNAKEEQTGTITYVFKH